jgi:DNA polymerase-3 subunit alpha
MTHIQYSCGCKFNKDEKGIEFIPNIDNLNLNCSKTWNIISDGNTKGCFQLESRLGKSMAKKLKPSNIEELAALISIMRPGSLEAFRDGKSISNHYIDKKNGQESLDYFHPSLEPILKTTYGEMIYQEQAMEIAKELAGFNLQEADMLRKAIGKKKPEEMSKLKSKFIEGCLANNIVNKNQAEEIFNWIEKSQRYSFNKSHAVSYAINGYLSAYCKAHFPRVFFSSYLKYAKDKMDPQAEIKELIQNANEMNVTVKSPDIRNLNKHFLLKNKDIYFGLTDIKNVGDSVYEKIITIANSGKIDIQKASWHEILINILLKINTTGAKALISCGAFDYFGKSRNKLLYEYNTLSELTQKEIDYISNDNFDTIQVMLNYILTMPRLSIKRKEIINNLILGILHPPYSLDDSIEWLSDTEYSLLGYGITCSKIDMYDINMTNCTCRDFKKNTISNAILACEIEFINVVKTKKGNKPGAEMAFVNASDHTGCLDSIVFFPEQYNKYKNALFTGNVVVLCGNKNKNKDGLIVDKLYLPRA